MGMPYMPKSAKPVEPYMPKSAQPVGSAPKAAPSQEEDGGIVDALKGLVVPSRSDVEPIEYTMPAPERSQYSDEGKFLEAVALHGKLLGEAHQRRLAAIRLNALSRTVAALEGMNPLGIRIETDAPGVGKLPGAGPEEVEKASQEAVKQNPKTALAAGVIGPNAPTVAGRIAVALATGTLGAANRGQDPLAGGAATAGLTAAVEGLLRLPKGAAKVVDTRRLFTPVSEALRELHIQASRGEPVTNVSPLALHERQTVVGEVPTEVVPPNLLHPFEAPDFPTRAGGEAAPGVPTKAERPYFAERTNVSPLRADEFPVEPGTKPILRGVDPDPEVQLQRMSELAAERPTGKMHPDELLSESAFNRKNQEMLSPRGIADLLQANERAGAVELERNVSPDGPVVDRSAETHNLRVPPKTPSPEQVKFDEAMSFLEGTDDPALAKTATRYVPRDINVPEPFKDPNITHVPSRKVPAPIGGGAGDAAERAARQAERPNPASRIVAGPPSEGTFHPTEVPESLHALSQEGKDLIARDNSWWEKFKRSLSLPENRADGDVAAAIRSLRGARAMKDIVTERLFPKLNAAVKSLPSSEQANVRSVIKSLRDRKGTLADVSKLPQEFRNLFVHLQREQQAMTVELAKAGYYSQAEMKAMRKLLSEGQLHLHRSYQAFLTKKGSFKPSENAMRLAEDFFMKELELTRGEAFQKVRAVLLKVNEEAGPKDLGQTLKAFQDAGLMKQRKLPPQLRPLLGVVNDPAFIVADTAAEMAQLYHQMHATRAIASPQFEGRVWSRAPIPGMHPERLWDATKGIEENRRLFGELAGKYVAPQLHEAMKGMSSAEARSLPRQLISAAVGWFAFAKILTSPTTLLRNLMSNTFNLSVSGVYPQHWPRLFSKAAQVLHSWSKSVPLREAGAGEWMQMALEDYAIAPGRGSDWGGREARRIIEEVVRKRPDGLVGAMDTLFRKYGQSKAFLGRIYELGDTVPRLMAYMHHVEDGVKTLGLPMAAARARASHIVNRYFATGSSVGPLFRKLSQSGGSPVGSWLVDNMRVTKNIMADASKGQVGPLVAATAFSAIPMAVFYGLRQLYGVTDAEVSANERRLKGSWRERQAFHDWVPVRTKDGTAYAISFDGLNPMAAFLKGGNLQQAWQDPSQAGDVMSQLPRIIAANVISGLTSSGWAEPFADTVLAQLGIAPGEYAPPVLPGQEGWRFLDSVQSYMQPTLMRQFQDVARKAQLAPDLLPLRPTEEEQTLGGAAFTSFNPLSIEKVGARSMEGARRQEQGKAGELKRGQKAAQKLPSEEREKVQNEAQKRKEELRRKQGSR